MAKTRAQLRTNARARADQDASDFPTDAQYNVYLDEAGTAAWRDLIHGGWPVDFSTTTVAGTGAAVYALGVGAILGVHGVYMISGADYLPLRRANEGQRAALMSQQASQNGWPGFYEVRTSQTLGPVIEFLPKANAGIQFRVDYVPEWPGFSGDSDTWWGPSGSDECVELYAAAIGCTKEQRFAAASELKQDYGSRLEQALRMAGSYDLRNPAMIRDVYSPGRRFAFDYPVAGGGWDGGAP